MALSETFRTYLNGPAEMATIEYKDRVLSRGKVRAAADAVEAILSDAGIEPGAGIGLIARNTPAHIAALLGLMAERRTVVMLHAYQSDTALAEEVRQLKLPVLLGDVADWRSASLTAAARETGALTIALDGDADDMVATLPGMERPGPGPFRPATPDIAIEMLSSGTTGAPKRAPISFTTFERAIADAGLVNMGGKGASEVAPHIQFFPLGNISGIWGLIPSAAEGRSIVILPKFEPLTWARTVHRLKARQVALPPAAVQMVLDADIDPALLKSAEVIRCGSAKLDPDLQERFEKKYDAMLLAQYGATEFGGIVAGWTVDDHRAFAAAKRGSTGRARPGMGLRIVDAGTGAAAPTGASGLLELLVPRISDVWIRTTELAHLDEDGFLYIDGRADSVINRGGFKISPETVADALCEHPAVRDAAVFAAPSPRVGEVPVAAVELHPDVPQPLEADLIAQLRNSLGAVYAPARVFMLDTLPRTASLKVDRGALGPQVLELFAADGGQSA